MSTPLLWSNPKKNGTVLLDDFSGMFHLVSHFHPNICGVQLESSKLVFHAFSANFDRRELKVQIGVTNSRYRARLVQCNVAGRRSAARLEIPGHIRI